MRSKFICNGRLGSFAKALMKSWAALKSREYLCEADAGGVSVFVIFLQGRNLWNKD